MELALILIRNTFNYSAILLIVALGGMFAERSGIINLALEGTMVIGAFVGTYIMYLFKSSGVLVDNKILVQLIAMVVAGVAGMVFSLLLALAAVNLKANQTITGCALNILAPALVIVLAKQLIGNTNYAYRATGEANIYINKTDFGFAADKDLGFFGELIFGQISFLTIIIALLLAASYIFLYKTKPGLRLRSCGEHPQAADSLGINVYKNRYLGVIISGLFAGIGGLAFVLPFNASFNVEAGVAGYGFLALAVMIFGNWHPIRILGAALLFGFFTILSPLSGALSIDRLFGDNSGYIFSMLPYIVTMVVLVFTSKSSRAPKAEGIPYDKGLR